MKLWQKLAGARADYRYIFGTDEGQRVLKDLMQRTHMFGTTFDGNPHAMAYNEGRRSVVLHIMKMLEVNPEQYRHLYGESIDEYLENTHEGEPLDG